MRKWSGRAWLFIGGFIPVLFFVITYPVFYLFTAHPKMYFLAHAYRKIWGWIVICSGIFIPRVTGKSNIPKGKRIIYVVNHSSYLDIVSTTCFLPGVNIFMAKQELTKVPLFGRWFKTIDISVHRQSNVGSHKAFVEASSRVKDFKQGLIIFPEGTIPINTPKLNPFKNGAFKLAIELGAWLVPVTLPDNHKRLPDGKLLAFPGWMRVQIHRAISAENLKVEEANALRDKVFAIIEKELSKSITNYHENHQ